MTKKELRIKLKSLKTLDIILVEWVDAEKDDGAGWVDIEEVIPTNNQRYVTAVTVGFYIGYSKELLRCTSDYDKSNKKIYGTNDIQLSNIKSIARMVDIERNKKDRNPLL